MTSTRTDDRAGRSVASTDAAPLGRTPRFDRAALWARMGADGVMISDLVELLAVDGPAYASTLTTAIAASDFAEADRVAHTLKGSISYFEARPAFELARQVEMAARTRQASEARALASRLTLEIAHLIAELQEWVQTLPSAAPPQTVGRDAVLVPRG